MEARMRAAVCSPGEPKSAIETIAQITNGYVLPRCLHVVADLGVADVLDDSPESAASLAQKTGTNPDALDRVLRLLAAHGVFHVSDGSYHHSPASRLLRTDHPQSMRAFVRMVGLPICWDSFREMSYSIRTGRPAADQIVKGGFWEYFRQSPETGCIFDAAHEGEIPGAYPLCSERLRLLSVCVRSRHRRRPRALAASNYGCVSGYYRSSV